MTRKSKEKNPEKVATEKVEGDCCPWSDLEAWGNCSWFTCETKTDDKSKKDAVKQFAGILR